MFNKLADKGTRDQELQNSTVYQSSLQKLKECLDDFKGKADEREQIMNQ